VVPPDSDLEEIVHVNGSSYLLSGVGILYEVPDNVKDSAGVVSYKIPSEGKNDFESIYYDPTVNAIIAICKSCAYEKGQKSKSAFRFDLETKTFDSSALFRFKTEDVKELLKDQNAEFDPSAAAIHPINKRLYILSSAGNLLVIADTRGTIIEAYKLNPDKYPQAEGIAFAPDGSMFISNEGKYGNATLLMMPYKVKQTKK
jgi:hypothetical protein